MGGVYNYAILRLSQNSSCGTIRAAGRAGRACRLGVQASRVAFVNKYLEQENMKNRMSYN